MSTAILMGLLAATPSAWSSLADTLPELAGPDRVLAEMLIDLSGELGAPVIVGISGPGADGMTADILRRLPEDTVGFIPSFDELGARAAVGAAVTAGGCGAVIHRVPQGWEYDTLGDCPDTYERPDEAYAAGLAARVDGGQSVGRWEREYYRSVGISGVVHATPRAGEACLTREVENPDPPPATVSRQDCWLGPVGASPKAWGMELSWGRRAPDSRIARDVRLELGQLSESGHPVFAPSVGFRAWSQREWLFAGARVKTFYLHPGATASVGVTLGKRSPITVEVGGELGGVALAGSGATVAVGGTFGER